MPEKDSLHILQIASTYSILVTLRSDGSLEYGPDYTPDEAAKIFWEAIASAHPYKESICAICSRKLNHHEDKGSWN